MAGQVKLTGSLTAGPAISVEGGFPATVQSTPIATNESPKPYTAATGILSRAITTVAAVFLDLGEPGNAVAAATILYFRADNLVLLRQTVDDGAGGDVVIVTPIAGLFIQEYPATRFLKQLEIDTQGELVNVEYFLAGT